MQLRLDPQGLSQVWDLSLEVGIWASRLGLSLKAEILSLKLKANICALKGLRLKLKSRGDEELVIQRLHNGYDQWHPMPFLER